MIVGGEDRYTTPQLEVCWFKSPVLTQIRSRPAVRVHISIKK